MIPAGIRTGETEFFRLGEEIPAMHEGVVTEFESLPAYIYVLIDSNITPVHHASLDEMKIWGETARRKQWVKCNCSAYDFTPDIIDGHFSINTEYVDCGFRGICAFEGKLCQVLQYNGQTITFSQLKITSLIRKGMQDKEICDELNIAPQTLRVHKSNIQIKLEAERKPEIVARAIEIGIE